MRPLAFGLQLFPGEPRACLDEARAAEQLGFDSIWTADHFHGAGRSVDWVVPECIVLLGGIAAVTSSVRLGTCVASTTKRDPALLAHSALTLAAVSEGRFELGLGTGFGPDLNAFGVSDRKPARRLEESLAVIRELFRSSPSQPYSATTTDHSFEGAFLNIPAPVPPIHVAAIGPRTLSFTGRQADGWLPFALTPDLYGAFLAQLAPQRSPFSPKLWLPTFLEAPGEDLKAEAEATGRLYLSMAPSVLGALGFGSSAAPSTARWTPGSAEEINRLLPRELALEVVLHGSPEECVEKLARFAEQGCEEIVLRITDPERRRRDAALIAREILEPMRGVGNTFH